MDIRPIVNDDFSRGFVETMRALSPVDCSVEELKKVLWKIHRDANHQVFVAVEEDETVIGTVSLLIRNSLTHRGQPIAYLEDLAVHPEYQKRGIGFQLVKHIIITARANNCRKLILSSTVNNAPFYEKMGFRRHELEMRKDLE